jgi:hypothetical protein
MPAKLEWFGGLVADKMAAAATLSIDYTMAECVTHGKDNHPSYPPASEPYTRFANRTGFQTSSIQILEDASLDGTLVGGQWGSDSGYALYLEIGTSESGPTAEAREAVAAGNMSLIPPPIGPLMAPRPYLRPATDIEYPQLAGRIGVVYRGESIG